MALFLIGFKQVTPMNTELVYSGKVSEQGILADTPTVSLKKIEGFGQRELDGWDNMLIFGDSLPTLKTLLREPRVAGQVRLVYIDPPFGTNQEFRSGISRTATVSSSVEDESAYQDTLVGGEYLEFLRRRLILLREVLAEGGSIYVHIDCKMGHYVKILMDQVFGPERFVNDITRVKCNPKNFARKGYGNIKDIIFFYSKTDHYVWNDPRERMTKADIRRLFAKVDQDGRRYTTTPLHAPGETKNGPTGRPWKGLQPPRGRHWRYPPDELTRLDEQGLIEWSSTGNPRKKIYAEEVMKRGKKRQDIWEFKDPAYPSYPTEKNLDMLKLIIEASSNPGDLVLDCFAGSGTTLVAAEMLARRWIGIDNSAVAIDRAKKRIEAIKGHRAFAVFGTSSAESG